MCFWRRKKKAKDKPVEKKAEVQQEEKAKPVKQEEKAKPVKEEEKVEEKREVKDIYHVSMNNSEKSPHFKRWRVRKQGSKKTIKYFDTQAEAIDFANNLAKNADGHIVIHKMDGTIRKQNY